MCPKYRKKFLSVVDTYDLPQLCLISRHLVLSSKGNLLRPFCTYRAQIGGPLPMGVCVCVSEVISFPCGDRSGTVCRGKWGRGDQDRALS